MAFVFLIILCLTNIQSTTGKLYQNNLTFKNNIVQRLDDIFPLFNETSDLCVVSNDSEFISSFIFGWKSTFKPVKILNYFSNSLCNDFVMLDVEPNVYCTVFDGILNPSVTSFYLLLYKTSVTTDFVEECLLTSWLARVVMVSILEGVMMELSPVYPTPRHFIPSTPSQVAQPHDKSNMPDLGGENIKAVTSLYPPFSFFEIKNTTVYTLDEIYGIELLILKHMTLKLNFTINNIRAHKDEWGILLPNNSFQGGIGQAMEEGTADMVLENVWIIQLYHSVVDFGPPIDQFKWSFLTRRPTQVSFQWVNLLSIYQTEVLVSSLAAFVMVVVIYWFGINYGLHRRSESWTYCVLTVFGYLTMTYSRTRKGNTCFTITSWSIFAVLLSTSLSTNIVLRLTLPVFTPRIDSTQQLVEGGYYWATTFYGSLENEADLKKAFFNSENYWDAMFIEKFQYLSPDVVADRAGVDMKITFPTENRGKFVVVLTIGVEKHPALYDYRMSKAVVQKIYTSCFAVRKNSPLNEPFTWITNIFMETGLIQHWWDEVLTQWPNYDSRHVLKERDNPTLSEPEPLKLERIQALFLLLVSGLSLSTVVFVIEICYHYFN